MNPLDPYRSMEPRQIEDQPCDGDLRFRLIGSCWERLEIYKEGLWYVFEPSVVLAVKSSGGTP